MSHPNQYAAYSDPALIQHWLNGEEQAFDVLYKRYVLQLLNLAVQKTGSREMAKELVQEVFMELYLHRSTLQTHTSLQGYLFTILKNRIYNYYRHQLVEEKYRQHVRLTTNTTHQETAKRLEQKQLLEKIHAQVQQLPSQCKTVFLLSREEHLSNKEIAERLHISVHTVEQHIRKARRILKESLGDYEFGLACVCLAAGCLL